MIRHTVVLKFKQSIGAASQARFFEEAKKLANIQGVEHFECLKQVSDKNKYEYGLSMEFASAELYNNYSNHPDHTRFVQEFWLNNVEDFLEIDYELLK